jgi:hypothetical protein
VRAKVAQTQDELLKWIKNLNPGLNTKNWRILDKQSERKGQRLILHIDRDSFLAIKRTGYKIFTGPHKELTFVQKPRNTLHNTHNIIAASYSTGLKPQSNRHLSSFNEKYSQDMNQSVVPVLTKFFYNSYNFILNILNI